VLTRNPTLGRVGGPAPAELPPLIAEVKQNHTSVVFGDRLILKLFRQLEAGIHPEVEIGRVLTARDCPHGPPLLGTIEYRPRRGEPTTLAVLHGLVPNQGNAGQHALVDLDGYRDRVRGHASMPAPPTPNAHTLLELAEGSLQKSAEALVGPFLDLARLLGRRTAELHGALAVEVADPAFAPEPFTPFDQRSMYQAMRGLTGRVFHVLRRAGDRLPEPLQREGGELLEREEDVFVRLRELLERRIATTAIRCHGDYHLGQVLVADSDVAIIDFEGEPNYPLAERRLKRPPLRDVAGMLRSVSYAADVALRDWVDVGAEWGGMAGPDLETWARYWQLWTSAAFLREYLDTIDPRLVPASREDCETLLDIFLLEQGVYQLGHELRTRPAWVGIPLRDLQRLLAAR
jgi:trehalose synthase-fused probable maltokinase